MRCGLMLLALLFTAPAGAANPCGVTEQDLLGAWSCNGDSGFFEEMELTLDGGVRRFDSWLHQRPELSAATWTLRECRLTITPAHGESEGFDFTVLGLGQGKLRLRDDSDGELSSYARINEQP